jgi:hypothetical protein
LNVALNGEPRPRLFVKRIDGARDFMARATNDDRCRSVTLWQHGLLDRFPREVASAVIACAKDEPGHAILMANVRDDLMAQGARMTPEDNDVILDAMAALHAEFWLDPALLDPDLGLCSSDDILGFLLLPPKRAAQVLREPPSLTEVNASVLHLILEGWEVLPDFIGAAAADRVQDMANAHPALSDALSRYPWTLVHNDVRDANLAVRRPGVEGDGVHQVVALDMARAARMPPALDLGWYMSASFELAVLRQSGRDRRVPRAARGPPRRPLRRGVVGAPARPRPDGERSVLHAVPGRGRAQARICFGSSEPPVPSRRPPVDVGTRRDRRGSATIVGLRRGEEGATD